MALSLTRNFNSFGEDSPQNLKFQLGALVSELEDHLNKQVNIHLINSSGHSGRQPLPTLKQGDLFFDFGIPGVATLQQWDGKRFISFNLAYIAGFINLITQGIGSGTNPTLFLRSDGAGHWTLDSPSKIDTADINLTEDIPAFNLVTANGKRANSSTLFHFGHVIGLSTVAVLNGFTDTVVVQGEVINGGWSWINNDKIFLNGTSLSTTPPTTGFSQYIGTAKNNNTIFVRLQQPILL